MPIPDAAQCCLLYSALAPEGEYGTVLLPALLDVENEAGPVLVAEVKDFRLVSAPSMMKMGGCGGLNAPLHLRARNQLCREIVWRNIAQPGLFNELFCLLKEQRQSENFLICYFLGRLCFCQSKFLKKKGGHCPPFCSIRN